MGVETGIPTDGACIECGYELAGLPDGGVCPECGLAVAASRRGDALEYSSPRYLAGVVRGFTFVLRGILGLVALAILGPLPLLLLNLRVSWARVALGAAMIAVGIVMVYGYWRMSAADPRDTGDRGPTSAAALFRATMAFFVVAFSIAQVLRRLVIPRMAPGTPALTMVEFTREVSVWAGAAVLVVHAAAAAKYVGFLAGRVPDGKLLKRAEREAWLLPLLAAAAVGAQVYLRLTPTARMGRGVMWGLIGLVALIAYWNLLDAARKRLVEVLGRARLNEQVNLARSGAESVEG